MRRMVVGFAVVAALGALLGGVAQGADELASRPDPDVKDWYQRRGNAARSAVSAFKPLRAPPVETFRIELPDSLVSNVVTWDGVVYVATSDGRSHTLRAYDVGTGEKAGAVRLRGGSDVELAVWNGTVIAVQEQNIAFRRHKNNRFFGLVDIEGSFRGSPMVHKGDMYVRDGRDKLLKTKVGRRDDPTSVGTCAARPAVLLVHGRPRVLEAWIGESSTYVGKFLYVFGRDVSSATPRRVQGAPDLVVHRLEDGHKGGYLVVGQYSIKSADGDHSTGCLFPDASSSFMAYNIESEPVVAGNRAFGWTRANELEAVAFDGALTLMERGTRPEGFSGRELSAAQDVLYVGNAAVEMSGGRVLWCHAGADPQSPLIPAGDGRIVFIDRGNKLVGLSEPETTAADEPATAPVGAIEIPQGGDGILLADGRQVLGKLEVLDDGGVRVTPEGGKPEEFRGRQIALCISGGKSVGPSDPLLCYRVWRGAVRGKGADELAKLVRQLTRERLISEARRILERARDFGLSEERISELGTRMTGLAEDSNISKKLNRVRRQENEIYGNVAEGFLAGIEWLRARGQDRAASALLDDVAHVVNFDEAWETRARELMPEEFPFSGEADAGRSWARWARALLPSGAEFASKSSPIWRKAQRDPWKRGAIALVSKNMHLVSRSEDAEVVGGCMQRGETAVRALEQLLYDDNAPEGEAPLLVFLHKSREEYLAERTPSGTAPPWSAGYFAPGEGVSRFFVPAADQDSDPLGRGLYSTLAHELTHHWIEMRWASGHSSSPMTHGYWVVEGIAQYIGDQAADSDAHTVRLDNPRVPSLDAMAQAAAARVSLPLSDFVDMPQLAFVRLGGEEVVTVQLRNTLGGRILSERSLFYEQSAAFTWFMMNRRGKDGRERTIRYLWAQYTGRAPRGGWKSLGFESENDMADKFGAFLTELAGKRATVKVGSRIPGGGDLPEAAPSETARSGVGQDLGTSAEEGGDFEVGDAIWIDVDGELYPGEITGQKDGKFWVNYGIGGTVARELVGPDRLRHR